MKIAIVSVAYNRIDCLRRQFDSLEHAEYDSPVTLIISIDKSNTDAVELMARGYHWPYGNKRIVAHDKNLGLRAHILSLGSHFNEFDALIVLEDDVTVGKSFYLYAKACIEKYYGHNDIAGISLYNFPMNNNNYLPFTPAKSKDDVYFMNCAMSWGQVWMKPQWEKFMEWYRGHSGAFNLEHLPSSINSWPKSSWLKYHIRYCIEENKYFVYPYFSLSTNNADPGVNFDHIDTMFQTNMLATLQKDYSLPDFEQAEIKYDGFYQPKYLGRHLSIPDDELCVDLFSNKPQCMFRHYLLSNRTLPYKVVKSYALQLRPIEMNIICNREGHELWLYDTTVSAPAPKAPDRYLAYAYFYQKGFYKARTMIGPRRILRLLVDLVKSKF